MYKNIYNILAEIILQLVGSNFSRHYSVIALGNFNHKWSFFYCRWKLETSIYLLMFIDSTKQIFHRTCFSSCH